MLCAIYTRLSKEDEDKRQSESESIQNQKAMLLRYAKEQGWDIYHVYCDEDYSGADRLRPDFNRMLRDAQDGKFQILLCKTQSRFTRDMELVERYLHGLFPLWGIRFIAVADNADTLVKGNKKARQINGLVNEWYLEDLSENIRMVFASKRQQGQYIGGIPLYGYQKDPQNKNHLLIDPEAAAVVRQIFSWSLEGLGRQRIATQLNAKGILNPTDYKVEKGWIAPPPPQKNSGLWNKTTVWRILHNELYTGVMVQGRTQKLSYKSPQVLSLPPEQWCRVPGTHEAIISPEVFQAVQQGLNLRTRTDSGGSAHPLAGLVRCMDCGASMSKCSNGRSGEKRRFYLRCKRYADSGTCSRHSIRLDALLSLTSARVRCYVQSFCPPETLDLPKPEDSHRTILLQEQRALDAQLERRNAALRSLYLDKVSGVLGEEQFSELNQEFLTEKNRFEQRKRQLAEELKHCPPSSSKEQYAESIQKLLQLDSLPRELAILLIDHIEIGERNPVTAEQAVKICWKF